MNDLNKKLQEQLVSQMSKEIEDDKKVEQYGDILEGLSKVEAIMKNDNDNLYIKFIEETRVLEEKRLKELKEKFDLTEEEADKMAAYEMSTLSQEDYLIAKFADQNKLQSFIDTHPEETSGFFSEMNKQREESDKEIEKDYPELDDNAKRTASIMDTFVKLNGDSKLKTALNVAKFAANPVGFVMMKPISKMIGYALRTETGQNMLSNLKSKWEDVKGGDCLKSKKGLLALATVGAVAAIGTTLHATGMIDMTEIGEVAFEAIKSSPDSIVAAESGADLVAQSVAGSAQTAADTAELAKLADTDLAAVLTEETPEATVQTVETPEATVQTVETPEATTQTVETPEATTQTVETPDVEPMPTEFVIESGDRLESLVGDMLPKDATYDQVRELTRQVAEFNNMSDADMLQIGQEIKIPSPEELEGIQLKEFKIDSIEDLNDLNKVPYGSELTPAELKVQISEMLEKTYPDDEVRVHEFMAHVNANLDALPQDKVIDSRMKLDLGENHKELLVDRSFELSDERTLEEDSPYDWDTINELKEETKVDPKDTPSYNNRVSGRPGNTMGSK